MISVLYYSIISNNSQKSLRPFAFHLLGIVVLILLLLMVFTPQVSGDNKDFIYSYQTGGDIRTVDVSDDGDHMVVGSADNKVYYFRKSNSSPIWSYTAEDNVLSVAISADGNYIAAGANAADRRLYFFSKSSSTPLWSYKTDTDPIGGGDFSSIAISDNGEYIAVGHANDYVYAFHKDSNTPLWKYKGGSNIGTVAISGDGEYIVAGSLDDKVRLFEIGSSTPLWTYTTGDKIRGVAISEDGEIIAAASLDNKVYLWDKDNRIPQWSYNAGGDAWSVALSDSGEKLVAGTGNQLVLFFDTSSSTPQWEFTTNGVNKAASISGNGEYILVGSESDTAYCFESDDSSPIWTANTNDEIKSGVKISFNGFTSIIGSFDDKMYVYETHIKPDAYIDSMSHYLALEEDTISLSGHGEDSRGRNIMEYRWSSSRDGFLGNEEEIEVSGLSVGAHTIQFRVKNDEGKWSADATEELIIHSRPTANIEHILSNPATNDEDVEFKGDGTDDGYIMKYSWASDIDGPFYNGSSDMHLMDDLSLGEHTISLVVQDENDIWSYPATTTLIIHERPDVEIFSVLPSPAVEEDTLEFDVHTEDDGTIIASNWRFDRNGAPYVELTDQPTNLPSGSYKLYYSVKDNYGAWSEETSFSFVVYKRPEAMLDPTMPTHSLEGNTIQMKGSAEDDGWITRYVWYSSLDGELHNATTIDFSTSLLSHGLHTISLRVLDNHNIRSNDTSMEINVHSRPVAVLSAITPNPALDTEVLTYSATGQDDGSITQEVWTIRKLGNLVYNGSVPPTSFDIGTYEITYQVQDNHGIWSLTQTMTVIVHEKPVAAINPSISDEVKENEDLSLLGSGSDDGTIVKYVWRSSVDGELYNGSSDEVSISTLSKGDHIIYLKVQDNHGVWSDEVSVEVSVVDDFILFQKAGPLPIIAYLVIIVIIAGAGVFVMKQQGAKKPSTPSTGSPTPSPGALPQQQGPTPQRMQQPQSIPAPPPQPATSPQQMQYPRYQAPLQQSQPPRPQQQQPPQMQSQPQQQPQPQQYQQPPRPNTSPGVQLAGGGLCMKCGSQNSPDYQFCLRCGGKL